MFSKRNTKIMSVDNVTILSKANGTSKKVSPKTTTNIVGGLLLGLVIAIVIVVLKEILDKRIKSEEDVKKN